MEVSPTLAPCIQTSVPAGRDSEATPLRSAMRVSSSFPDLTRRFRMTPAKGSSISMRRRYAPAQLMRGPLQRDLIRYLPRPRGRSFQFQYASE